jgi:hypothetical protein
MEHSQVCFQSVSGVTVRTGLDASLIDLYSLYFARAILWRLNCTQIKTGLQPSRALARLWRSNSNQFYPISDPSNY